jgi:hypothetical protein
MPPRAPLRRSDALPIPAPRPQPAPRRVSEGERQRTGRTLAERSATRGEIVRFLRDAVRGIELSFRVAGSHGDGVSNQELVGYLEAGGREFDKVTPAMRSHILSTILAEYENGSRIPYVRDVRKSIGEAALDWIIKRFHAQVRDVHLKQLTLRYARAKAKAGYGNNPIGIRTGKLVDAIEERGKVVVTPA